MARILQCLICFAAIVASVLSHPSPLTPSQRTLLGVPIGYPSYIGAVKRNVQNLEDDVPQITEECRKRGFCVEGEVLNYPEEFAQKLVDEQEVKRRIDSSDDDDNQIGHRIDLEGDKHPEIPICPAERTIIYPKTLQDNLGEHHLVVNPNGAKKVQGFSVELCTKNKTTQDPVSPSPYILFERHYKGTGCRQRYIYRVIDSIIQGKHQLKKLKVPSHCTCSIVHD